MESLFPQLFSNINQAGSTFLQVIGVLEIIGYLLIVIFIGGIIYCVIVLNDTGKQLDESFSNHFINRTNTPVITPRMDRWNRVVNAMSSPDEQLWRAAIIDADTMLEEVIDAMGISGETFGEKLKSLGRQVPWIDAAWEVHKLRNILAHEGGRYHLNHREAFRAYKIYEGILYETGYLS